MKILGIDFGEKYIGLAISDESRTLARPLKIITQRNWRTELRTILNAEEIKKIVIGMPYDSNGMPGAVAPAVQKFGKNVALFTKLPVDYVDERFSSVFSEKQKSVSKKNKKDHANNRNDDEAATRILQTFLDQTVY